MIKANNPKMSQYIGAKLKKTPVLVYFLINFI